ncbi:50S small subunit ribosomal protein L37 [Kwoniella heveanensis CBS 569]|uniref:Large ribosomal subunit protein mL54 n=1 Tax=Kwoniella heveanensis BCC8398 TaxID=1296120 RepID=A0A1B9GNK4_9TREE|nr:50S small subunit ribosomal protein L37 [Kwoniella heveanensis BCC8398]OCF45862.1 50S small subunit ribosomal protein L37 [Kwoniella heveanensis CBS 569]
MSLLATASRSASKQVARQLPVLRTAVASFSSTSSSSAGSSSSSAPQAKAQITRPPSICPAGTTMTGLSILKDKPDPVALADEEYPAWLWTILDDTSKAHKAAENEVELHQEGQAGFDPIKEKRKLKNL